jgi:hypothetical protein
MPRERHPYDEAIAWSHHRRRCRLTLTTKGCLRLANPDNAYRTLEVRGRVESMDPDVDAAFYRSLQRRYGSDVPVLDADVRVVIVVEPTDFVAVFGGLTTAETVALTALLEKLGEQS